MPDYLLIEMLVLGLVFLAVGCWLIARGIRSRNSKIGLLGALVICLVPIVAYLAIIHFLGTDFHITR